MLSASDFLWLLASLCRMLRLPFDERMAAQSFPPPHDRSRLEAAARSLGMRVAAVADLPDAELPTPGVAWLGPGEGGSPAGAVLVVRADGARLLCFAPDRHESFTLPVAEARGRLDGDLLLFAAAAPADAADPDGAAPARRFGFRWFVPELLRHRSIWRQVILASVAIQLVGLATPLFTQVVIDKVVVHHTTSTLWAVGVALAMFMLFAALMTWMRQYLVLHTGNRIDAVLGAAVFAHLVRLPVAYFERRPVGTLVARLQGIESIRQFVAGAAVTLLLDCPFLVILLVVMFWYSWQLTLIALAAVLLIVLLSVAVTPLIRVRLDAQFLAGARVQGFLTEYTAAMPTVKTLQMEALLEDRYGAHLARQLGTGFATRQLANTYNSVAGALEQAMTLAILVAGALLVIDSAGSVRSGGAPFTIGMLVAFQMFASRMSQPLLRLAGLWQEFQQAHITVRRLADVMDAPAEPADVMPRRAAATAATARVSFEAVSFRYDAARPWVCRRLDACFAAGKLTLVTGPSGCGKSTLACLLQGFYPLVEGRILIDDIDLAHLSPAELRSALGVVSQETVLFAETIQDNVRMGHQNASFEDVVEACRRAGVHEFIERLPEGYRSMVGEHGVGLSGGQRQRIAIARALLRRSRVLIFDEASANLDADAAAHFAQTVNALRGQATVIFIAHHVPPGLEVDHTIELVPGGAVAAVSP